MTINTGKNTGNVSCGHTLDKTADSPEITLTATDIGQVVNLAVNNVKVNLT